MNYLAHAHVALAQRHDGAFVLGAMLPDFASMAGLRLLPQSDDAVRAGVQLHHRTDDVFHSHAAFISLSRSVVDNLQVLGVARGAARAIAHIGVELLLDGTLLQSEGLGSAYLEALGQVPRLSLEFRGQDPDGRFSVLHQRLSTYGVPLDLAHPERVAQRLKRVLEHRPRLAPEPEDWPHVIGALEEIQPHVQRAGAQIVADVKRECGPATIAP